MMRSRDLSKKVLVSLLTMSYVYLGGTCALPMAEAVDVTSNTDVSWRFQKGTYNFAPGLSFVFSDDKLGGVVISDYNPGITTASPSQTFNALGSLKVKSLNSAAGYSVGAFVDIRGSNAPQQSLYGKGEDIYLIGEYNSNSSNSQSYVSGLELQGNAIYDPNKQSKVYAQFDNVNTYLSAIVNPTVSTKGGFHALNLDHGAEAVFNGNAYLNLTMNDNASAGGSVLSSSVSHVEFNGEKTKLTGTSASTQAGTTLYGAYLHGDFRGGVSYERTNQLTFSGKEAAIDVTSSGSSDVFGIYAQNGYATVTGDVENFSVSAKATGNNVNRDVRGIEAWSHEIVDIQAKSTTISTHADAAIGSFHNTALYAIYNGHINIGGEKAVITSSGSSNGGVALYVYGRADDGSFGPGVTRNVGNDITINADDITISSTTTGSGEGIAAYVFAENDSATIHVNSDAAGLDQGKTVNVIGTIYASGNENDLGGKAFFNFGNEKSQFTGRAKYWPGDADGSEINIGLANNARWNMTGSSWVTNLNLNNAVVDMIADSNAYSKLTVENLQGSGGVIKQDVDVRSMESDKVLVTGDFSGSQALDIYQKDNYVPAAASTEGTGLVLASVNGNGTFTAKDREGTLFYTHYDLANKASETEGFTTDWYLNKVEKVNPEDDPTTSVDTVLAANALNYHTWRTENDKLLKRMGELRHNGEEEQGVWLRVKGSKIGRNGKFGFENKYTAYELGYDQATKRTADKTRYQGAAISYTDGNSSYSSGTGDNSSKSISFYNTEIGSKGHYLDLVFKISNMDNDFTVYDTNSNKITGDFNNTGVSLSAEYGRKNDLSGGWYIEPQAQFTLGYLGGDRYATSNGIEVNQSGIKSAVGRIGFNIGKEVGNKGIVYAKANLLHEFGGGYDVTMTDSTGRVKVSDSFNDTWFEYGIGAAFATGKSSHLYFDVERSTGSDFTKDWQWNVGARWNF